MPKGKRSIHPGKRNMTPDDFYAYMPQHLYIYVPTRELWPASSVNSQFVDFKYSGEKISAGEWLDRNRYVEQMTWAPGREMIIQDHLISDGGWIHRPGSTCFNQYRPPTIIEGDPQKAKMWLDHVQLLYASNTAHIVNWLAHRVQRPYEKINHALVLGGFQGIGKDTLLEPVKLAVGPWNFHEVSPTNLLGQFNSYVKSVILRINEAHDLGEMNRNSFYEHLKIYTAAPPDVLRCNEKNIRDYSVLNVCGVIITTNHKTNGIYLPSDDRRHFVAWSDQTKERFTQDYWKELYEWYEKGGIGHVTAYLRTI
jgi:hypothetical protein